MKESRKVQKARFKRAGHQFEEGMKAILSAAEVVLGSEDYKAFCDGFRALTWPLVRVADVTVMDSPDNIDKAELEFALTAIREMRDPT